MGAFVISKRDNGKYKFEFTSRRGKTIFLSPSYEDKEACEKGVEVVKINAEQIGYLKFKTPSGKFFFKLVFENEVLAISRKYTTALRVQKGIDEVVRSASVAELLDFSSDAIFLD